MCENLEKEFKILHGETINLTHDPTGQLLKNVANEVKNSLLATSSDSYMAYKGSRKKK